MPSDSPLAKSPEGAPAPVFVPPLTPRSPRFSAWIGPLGTFSLLFSLPWALIGSAIFVGFSAGGGPVWNDWILDLKGEPALASPLDVRSTGSRVNGRPVREIRFRFFDDEGREVIAASRTTDRDLLEKARLKAQLAIHFDPDKPQRARVDGTSLSFFGLFTLIPLAIAAGGWLGVLLTLRRALRRRRVLSHGSLATGKVLAVDRTNMQLNKRPLLKIRYSFCGPFGTIEGSVTNVDAPPLGADVSVLYDPDDPSKNCLPVPGTFGPA